MSKYDGNTLSRTHLFHAIMRGSALTNGTTYYEKNVVTWPTMCGGRTLLVEPHFDNLSTEVDDPAHVNWEHLITNSFVCGESGLLAINMVIPKHWYEDMYISVYTWVKQFNKRFAGEYRASVDVLRGENHVRTGIQEISLPLDHKRLVAIMSVENVQAHEECGGGYADEWECEECGGVVYECDDGYCEDCEWYTSNPENYSPDEDEEAGLTGDPLEDYDTLYNWDNAMGEHRWVTDTDALRWVPDHWPIGNGKWGTCLVNVQGKRDTEVMRDHSFDIDRFICLELAPQLLTNEGVVMISSNIAEPSYCTPYVMWQLINHRTMLQTSYGITLLHNKEHFATNPNERNHWIDAVVLVATDETYVRQCNARGRDM